MKFANMGLIQQVDCWKCHWPSNQQIHITRSHC